MNVVNYDKEMIKIINEVRKSGEKPGLLMHACCAPCSSACIERLNEFFDITVYYYNPNIDAAAEYNLRAAEQRRLCAEMNVGCIVAKYSPEVFYAAAEGKENEPEGGARCKECFTLRLFETARTASEKGFEYFCTTLTVSPLKNAALINAAGKEAAEKYRVKYLPSDFKKRGGYQRSAELSRIYGLYRQNYCGCEFSKNKLP